GDGGPERRAGEAADDADAKLLGRLDGGEHLLRGPLADAGGIAVAPDIVGQDSAMAWFDRVAHRLADAVGAEYRGLKIMSGEQVELLLAVVVVADCPLDFEMIGPAAELDALVAPFGDLGGELAQRRVGPCAAVEDHRPA